MDALYRPENLPCSQPIHLKEYFSKFAGLLSHQKNYDPGKISDPQLERDTSIDLLSDPPDDECDVESELAGSSKKKILKTTKIRDANQIVWPSLKKPNPNIVLNAANMDDSTVKSSRTGDEFALNVRIYHPFEFSYNSEKPNGCHKIKFSHEIDVLGSNTLAELRDKILCSNDTGIFREVMDPFVERQQQLDAKEMYPSGFIFIENVFYNDLRNPASIDYSEVIIQWAKKKRIQPLNVSKMEETRIDKLTPRFGYPYVYLHQGNCEHIVIFTDAWLTNSNIKLSDYPLYKGISRLQTRLCVLCNVSTPEWLVLNSDRLPRVRSFLCSECMFSYLYKDGQKIGSFNLYKFNDKNHII